MSIRINNILYDVTPANGCHSTISPNRFKSPIVVHSSGKKHWKHVMSTTCQYDQRPRDTRCAGCEHP